MCGLLGLRLDSFGDVAVLGRRRIRDILSSILVSPKHTYNLLDKLMGVGFSVSNGLQDCRIRVKSPSFPIMTLRLIPMLHMNAVPGRRSKESRGCQAYGGNDEDPDFAQVAESLAVIET